MRGGGFTPPSYFGETTKMRENANQVEKGSPQRTEGISRRKPSRGGAGTVPRPQDGESAAPKRSGFSSLGKICVFRRDVPES